MGHLSSAELDHINLHFLLQLDVFFLSLLVIFKQVYFGVLSFSKVIHMGPLPLDVYLGHDQGKGMIRHYVWAEELIPQEFAFETDVPPIWLFLRFVEFLRL